MRDHRSNDDMRDRRSDDDVEDRRDDHSVNDNRPWRETLENCREMKKAGKLSSQMKKECKAARKVRKASKQ
jgi:hypothetical protein